MVAGQSPFLGPFIVQYLLLGICHGRGREFECRRPRHSFSRTYRERFIFPWAQKGTKQIQLMSLARLGLRYLRFFWEQKRDYGLLRITLFRRHCLRVSIERHANCRMTQQLLHDLQFSAGRSE